MMFNDFVWKALQYIHPGTITYFSCGLLLLLFLYWLIKYPLVLMGGIAHTLKKINKVLIFGRSHTENISQIDDINKNLLLERMWANYCDDYAAGVAAPAAQYITKEQLFEGYAGMQVNRAYKYINIAVGAVTCLLGVLTTAVHYGLSLRELLVDINVAFMFLTIASITGILAVLYLMIEKSTTHSALRHWEAFESLSARRLPTFVPSLSNARMYLKLSNIERLVASCNSQLTENGKTSPEQVDLEMEYLERLSQGFISETTGTLTGYIQQLSTVLESNIKTQQLVRDSLKLLLNDLAIGVRDQRTINAELMQLLQKTREEEAKEA